MCVVVVVVAVVVHDNDDEAGAHKVVDSHERSQTVKTSRSLKWRKLSFDGMKKTTDEESGIEA